jgi:hypothetical protein
MIWDWAYSVSALAPWLPPGRVVSVVMGWTLFNVGVVAGAMLNRFVLRKKEEIER